MVTGPFFQDGLPLYASGLLVPFHICSKHQCDGTADQHQIIRVNGDITAAYLLEIGRVTIGPLLGIEGEKSHQFGLMLRPDMFPDFRVRKTWAGLLVEEVLSRRHRMTDIIAPQVHHRIVEILVNADREFREILPQAVILYEMIPIAEPGAVLIDVPLVPDCDIIETPPDLAGVIIDPLGLVKRVSIRVQPNPGDIEVREQIYGSLEIPVILAPEFPSKRKR